MSKRELQKAGVLARVKAGELQLTKAAEVMRISYRHAKRMWRRYERSGAAALKHGNAGRKSNRARPATVDVAISNSFGFGGHNATLVIRRPDPN